MGGGAQANPRMGNLVAYLQFYTIYLQSVAAIVTFFSFKTNFVVASWMPHWSLAMLYSKYVYSTKKTVAEPAWLCVVVIFYHL